MKSDEKQEATEGTEGEKKPRINTDEYRFSHLLPRDG